MLGRMEYWSLQGNRKVRSWEQVHGQYGGWQWTSCCTTFVWARGSIGNLLKAVTFFKEMWVRTNILHVITGSSLTTKYIAGDRLPRNWKDLAKTGPKPYTKNDFFFLFFRTEMLFWHSRILTVGSLEKSSEERPYSKRINWSWRDGVLLRTPCFV